MKLNTLSISAFFCEALAHMQLLNPPPFGGENNPFRTSPPDPYLQYPYTCCGRPDTSFCHGHLDLLGTPEGRPVATWAAGSVQNFSLTGIGNHYGGSCQVGFSIDNGEIFRVATSFEGNCPHRHNSDVEDDFSFTVPADIPTGDVIFAWTWFNREQEFNMNCAAITIVSGTEEPTATAPQDSAGPGSDVPSGSSQASDTPSPYYRRHKRTPAQDKRDSVPFSERPGMLVADIGNGCLTPLTTAEVIYPNPGPDVVMGDGEYPLELPVPPSECGY